MHFLYLFISTVLAAAEDEAPLHVIPPPANSNIPWAPGKFGGLALDVIDILFAVAGGIALIITIVLGIQMIISKGKPEDSKKVWVGLTYMALGFTIMGIAYAVVRSLLTVNF